jgi:hypothetical protein
LVADCKKCCVKDPAERKFTSAVLEVCPYRWAKTLLLLLLLLPLGAAERPC